MGLGEQQQLERIVALHYWGEGGANWRKWNKHGIRKRGVVMRMAYTGDIGGSKGNWGQNTMRTEIKGNESTNVRLVFKRAFIEGVDLYI